MLREVVPICCFRLSFRWTFACKVYGYVFFVVIKNCSGLLRELWMSMGLIDGCTARHRTQYIAWPTYQVVVPSSGPPLRQHCSRLIHPRSNLSTVGDRAFPVAGPQVWNSLPPEVTSAPFLDTFRRRLKAHLFTVS